MERQTFTIDEAAVLLGVAPHTAYRAARRGDIPTIRIGGRVLVPRAAMDRLLTGTVEKSTVDEVPTEHAKQAKA